MTITRFGRTPRFATLLAFAYAATSCGGKVVSAEGDSENVASEQDAGSAIGAASPPLANAPDPGTPSAPQLDAVAANCDSANIVYADVLDATGTTITGGPRLFPVRFAYSSGEGTSTNYVELSTDTGTGPNFIAVTVGGTSDDAEPLATMTYVEPPDDSGAAPFLALVIDGEDLMGDGIPSGSFAITALAGNSPDGVLLPYSLVFDVMITSSKGTAHVVGCGRWGG